MYKRQPYPSDNSIINLVVAIFGLSLVSMGIMQNQLNTIWDQTFYNPNQGGPNPNMGDPYNCLLYTSSVYLWEKLS